MIQGIQYYVNLRNQIVSYMTHLLSCSRIKHIPGSGTALLVCIVCYLYNPKMLYFCLVQNSVQFILFFILFLKNSMFLTTVFFLVGFWTT